MSAKFFEAVAPSCGTSTPTLTIPGFIFTPINCWPALTDAEVGDRLPDDEPKGNEDVMSDVAMEEAVCFDVKLGALALACAPVLVGSGDELGAIGEELPPKPKRASRVSNGIPKSRFRYDIIWLIWFSSPVGLGLGVPTSELVVETTLKISALAVVTVGVLETEADSEEASVGFEVRDVICSGDQLIVEELRIALVAELNDGDIEATLNFKLVVVFMVEEIPAPPNGRPRPPRSTNGVLKMPPITDPTTDPTTDKTWETGFGVVIVF